MLALNAVLSYNNNLILILNMAIKIETQSITPQVMEKPVDSPVRRVMMVPTVENPEDIGSFRKLTLEIDGKQIEIRRKWLYPTGDVLSIIKLAKGLTDWHLIYPLIRDVVNSKAVRAEEKKRGRRKIYEFSQKSLVQLTEMLLPRIDPYISLPEGPIILPDGKKLDKLTARQKALMILFINKIREKQKAITESDWAPFYLGLTSKEALSRVRGTIHELKALLDKQGCSWTIAENTELKDKPAYELLSIQDSKSRVDRQPLTGTIIPTSGSQKKENLKPEAMAIRQERLNSAREQLKSICTDIILSLLRVNGNLKGVTTDLNNFLKAHLPKNVEPYRFLLSDIVPPQDDKPYIDVLQEFLTTCLRDKLAQAVAPKPNEYFSDRNIKVVATDKKPEVKNDEGEKIIKAVCDHFEIKYEKPPTSP